MVVAFVGVFLWGVDTAFFYVPARTLLQRYAPAAFHGRVLVAQPVARAGGRHRDDAARRAGARRGQRRRCSGIVAGAIATVGGVVLLLLARRLAAPAAESCRSIPTAGSSRDAIALGGAAPG